MLIVHILNLNNSNLRNLKDDQVFFLSRLNKPAKYKKDSNFLSYLIYRIGKDDASGLAAQMTYHFVLAMFPMLLFLLLTLLPFFNIKQSQITNMLSNAPAETSTLIKSVIGDITQNPVVAYYLSV